MTSRSTKIRHKYKAMYESSGVEGNVVCDVCARAKRPCLWIDPASSRKKKCGHCVGTAHECKIEGEKSMEYWADPANVWIPKSTSTKSMLVRTRKRDLSSPPRTKLQPKKRGRSTSEASEASESSKASELSKANEADNTNEGNEENLEPTVDFEKDLEDTSSIASASSSIWERLEAQAAAREMSEVDETVRTKVEQLENIVQCWLQGVDVLQDDFKELQIQNMKLNKEVKELKKKLKQLVKVVLKK